MGCCQGKQEVKLDGDANNAASNPIHDASGPTPAPTPSEAEIETKLASQFGGSFRRPSIDQGRSNAAAARKARYVTSGTLMLHPDH